VTGSMLAHELPHMIPLKVLIVEDECLVSWGLETVMRERGHQVCGLAQSAEEAIAMASAHQPDVVLMDIGLYGKVDGLSAAREILRVQQTRMVFSSAWTDPATVHAIQEIRPYANFPKPCRLQDIMDMLDRAVIERGA
jgi:DNA-binding NarL/FixJ family response regulator